jgi:hypothetical protein
VGSITAARTDPWHCAACGAPADLAPLSAEVGLVRLARRGDVGFRLGSVGVEDVVSPLLAPCPCGGRLAPGGPAGAAASLRVRPAFDADALRPLATAGWAALEASADPRLAELARVWRPRAFRAMGRLAELTKPELLELKVESRLQALLDDMREAQAAGDRDAAEAAHARYVELGTTYVQRFVRGRERPAAGG